MKFSHASHIPHIKRAIHTVLLSTFLISSLCTTGIALAQSDGTPASVTNPATTPAAAANQDYTVLSPLPGTTNGDCPTTNTTDSKCQASLSKNYLQGIFNLAIGIGAVSAFVMLTFFGFEYMLSDSLNVKTNAKKGLLNAIWGLGFVIFAYAILNTLNPALVNGNLNIGAPTVPTADVVATNAGLNTNGTLAGNPCADPSSVECSKESNMRSRLLIESGNKITINSLCQQANCRTPVGGLTETTVKGVEAVQKGCNCSLIITGGDEVGPHDPTGDHPKGLAVDIGVNDTINSYFTKNLNVPADFKAHDAIINGRPASVLYETTNTNTGRSVSTGNHWHISFK